MTGPLLAERVRKCRREFACCLCGVRVQVGQLTGRLGDGTGWAHAPCIIAASRAAQPDGQAGQ